MTRTTAGQMQYIQDALEGIEQRMENEQRMDEAYWQDRASDLDGVSLFLQSFVVSTFHIEFVVCKFVKQWLLIIYKKNKKILYKQPTIDGYRW